MPTRNINLTAEQDAFIEEAVKSGRYQNASEAMRDAVRGLQARWREEELKLRILRWELAAGDAALARGDYLDIDDTRLDDALDRLEAGQAG